MPTVDQVYANVHQFLNNHGTGVVIMEDKSVVLRQGSALCIIDVHEWNYEVEGCNTIVSIDAAVVSGVKRSPALYEWIALNNEEYYFGHLVVRKTNEKELVDVWIVHNLLGDFLDEAEIVGAVRALLFTADQLDDEVMHTFGGKRTFDK